MCSSDLKDYSASTMWILEMLVAIGGNRPCALLGIKVGDWENRKSGFCPFNQSEENELVEDDPENDKRKVLKNPFEKPIGCDSDEPTGVLIQSDSDKISVGPPCYIWIPNEFVDLIQAHSLMASKILPRGIDIYHPTTLLFMNSTGNQIKTISIKHFREIGRAHV